MKLQDLVGNECAKRAIEVALSGNHSIVLISTIDSQAYELLEAAQQIAKDIDVPFNGKVVTLCKCKAYANPSHECTCTAKSIVNHIKSILDTVENADMIIETTAPMSFETTKNNELDENVIKRIKAFDNSKRYEIANDATYLLEQSMKHIKFDSDKAIRIANTIVNMDNATKIEARHICEAIQHSVNRTIINSAS